MDAAILIRDLEPFRQSRPVWDRAAEMILVAATTRKPDDVKEATRQLLVALEHENWNRTLRETHAGGAGDTVPVIADRLTGEERQAQILPMEDQNDARKDMEQARSARAPFYLSKYPEWQQETSRRW